MKSAPSTHGLIVPASLPRDIGGPGTADAVLERMALADPHRVVLVGRSGALTAAEVEALVARAAGALWALGVRPTDRVAASLGNDVDIVIAFFAAMRLGAIWLGINRPLAPPEKAYMLADSQTAVLLTEPAIADSLAPHRADLPDLRTVVTVPAADSAPTSDGSPSPRLAEDAGSDWRVLTVEANPLSAGSVGAADPFAPAAIAYTSGTTGFPKGAVHTQHNLLLPGLVRSRVGGPPGEVVLGVPLPLTILNLIVLGPLVAWQTGATLVAMDRVDAVGMAEWIRSAGITTFSAVPAMVHDLLTHPDVTDEMLASIQSIGVGGADMPDAFRRLYEARFGVRCGTGYGLTEAPTAVTVEDPTQPPVPGSCGRALPQVAVVIVDDDDRPLPAGEVGEVCIASAATGEFADVYRPMLGYWNRPAESAAALRNGLLHTGDLGTLDEAGNLTIKDRRNDLILRGGANIYPAEVERVLHDDPAVAACAVIGVPDERLGERVAAFVELTPGRTTTAEALRERCLGQLARYKVPDSITFVERFDRTPMGKIRKTALRTAT